MPGKRSLLRAYNNESAEKGVGRRNSVPSSWDKAAQKWNWKKRAACWDAYQRRLDQEKWVSRRNELREREWQMSQSALNKAEEMLKFPVARKVSNDGLTVVDPGKWTFRDAIAILVQASDLGRRACQMDEDLLTKRQLGEAYSLMKDLLVMDDSTSASTVKTMVQAHLESVLLFLGKPIPQVLAVLSKIEIEAYLETQNEGEK